MPAMVGSSPPLPPDVTAQQSPMQQYAQGAVQQRGAAPQVPPNQIEYAKKLMGEISNRLLELAQVLSVEKPAAMPLVKRMAMAGKAVEDMMGSESQGKAQPPPSSEPPQSSGTEPEEPGGESI